MSLKRKAIVVLGMHRSGTSAITRVLSLMGLALPDRLMPSVSENNETGFWESSVIADIHDRLLEEAGSSWDDCLRFPATFYGSEAAETCSREILQTLDEEFPENSDLVIKDPRICRFLPFWLNILDEFGADPYFVLISRHPLEVAASLSRRDQFPEARSLHLWLRHMLDMEHDSRDFPRGLITYGDLLSDWRNTVEKVSTDLGISWSRHTDEVEADVSEFLSADLRHHRILEPSPDSGPALYKWVFEVQSAFARAARDGRPLNKTFNRVAQELDKAEAVFSPAMAAVQTSLRDTDRLQHTALERAHARDKETYEGEIRKDRKLLAEFDAKVLRQQARMDSMQADHDEDQTQYEAEIAKIRSVLEESDAKVYALRDELESTVRDKNWVWERWHEVKGELQAIQTSKVGRLLWGQWSLYLALRRRLVRLKQTYGHQPLDPHENNSHAMGTSRGLGGFVRAAIRWPARLVARGGGLIYLSTAVASEHVAASARRFFRRHEDSPPRPAPGRPPRKLPSVLLVSPYHIYPPDHGGGVRLFNLVQRLAEHSHLHLLLFSQSGDDPEQRQALSAWARSVHFHHWQPQFRPGGLHLEPPNAGLFASDQAARQIADLLASEQIDILQLEYAELGQFGLPKFARVKVVLTEHDLAFRQHWRRRQMGFHNRYPEGNAYGSSIGDWLRLTRYELAVCRRADQIQVMSEVDGGVLSDFLSDGWDRIRVVPNAVDTALYAPAEDTARNRDVLYVGNFQNLPNVDALEYLVGEIWPLVRADQPEIGLTVVGANPSARITRFHGQDGIDVVGSVPDLRPYYHQHRIMVAPIRAGSGTRLKILEAFAAGIPVVSTTLGVEGIEAAANEHLLLADDARSFAQAIKTLLEDDALCARLSASAAALATEQYDWQRSADLMLQGWHGLLALDNGPTLGSRR